MHISLEEVNSKYCMGKIFYGRGFRRDFVFFERRIDKKRKKPFSITFKLGIPMTVSKGLMQLIMEAGNACQTHLSARQRNGLEILLF